jgi:collagen type VII alpha
MPGPFDLTTKQISFTFERLVQTDGAGNYYTGIGLPLILGAGGTSGTSGTNGGGGGGTAGTSGTSGNTGASGTSGTRGTSGTSGQNGTSGTSGSSGATGASGLDGTSGTSGTSGSSGATGASGLDGTSGTSGTSGLTGTSGSSGTSAPGITSGTSGIDGTSGTSGANGISSGQIYYFNQSISTTPAPYKLIDPEPTFTGQVSVVNNLTSGEIGKLVSSFITKPGGLGFPVIPGGAQRFHLHFLKDSINTDVDAYAEIELADGAGNLLGSPIQSNKSLIGWIDASTPVEVYVDIVLPSTYVDPTYRMSVRLYLDNLDSNARTVNWYTEGNTNYSYVTTTVGAIAGSSGVSGSSGTSGINGTGGTSGTDGSSGTSGATGFSGSSGTSGTDGSSGTSGATGFSGSSGTSGTDGSSGSSGSSGSNTPLSFMGSFPG